VVIALGVVLAIATELVLLRFGPAPRAVPISVAFSGLLFLLAALWIGPLRSNRQPGNQSMPVAFRAKSKRGETEDRRDGG
jgi:hypothetical protein